MGVVESRIRTRHGGTGGLVEYEDHGTERASMMLMGPPGPFEPDGEARSLGRCPKRIPRVGRHGPLIGLVNGGPMADSSTTHVHDALLEDAERQFDRAVSLRRRLHAHPELGLDLPRTQAAVLEELDDLGLDVSVGERTTSVTAVLAGARPGPTTLLRG
jgi:hypothetical protein